MPQVISSGVIDVYPFTTANGRAQYLTLLRTPGITLGNTWQAVHGRIEKRETAVRAAARELVAQTGLQPARLWNIDYVNSFYSPEEDAIYLVPSIGALITEDAEVELTSDHVNWEWASVEAAMRRFLWIGQRLAVQTLHDEIANPLSVGKSPNPYLQIDTALYGNVGRRGGR
ncbi:MAG: NUDIX domain-containing protein [Chloroflexota bacterium]|nr:NUDIX domain-containing protein [Chloroflexota bacterium]